MKPSRGATRDHEWVSPRLRGIDVATQHRSSQPDKATRQRVYARDQRCRYCGTCADRHLHHIVYRSQGGSHDDTNLIWLCAKHHDLVHSDKAHWQPILQAYIAGCHTGHKRFLLDLKPA